MAAVGEQRDREPTAGLGVGQHAEEAGLADGVAVVADQPVLAPAEADPAQAPGVAEHELVGQVGLVRGHRRGALLAQQAGTVRAEPAGEVQPREAEHVARPSR